ncbi:MAG: glutamate synthase large subunit [Sorangiineae bacterium]|nr:glutamate synthase large subunit [Polyangiaceae bacterium]MEB2322655.1 glutamate synthase large subunit [Sorangiineae bacterium]
MTLPCRSGLYDPRFEHDACGIGFVANIRGEPSHAIVRKGVDILLNLVHRGACGCDPLTGDGAGLLVQLPHGFFAREASRMGLKLPSPGRYGVGCVFLPRDKLQRQRVKQIVEDKILGTGQRLIGWRPVPVDEDALGPMARASAPIIEQVLVGATTETEDAFERKLYVIRKWAETAVRESGLPARDAFYVPSLSSRTIVYKGLLLAEQLTRFYRDLDDPDFASALAMVHQRFSTNTFPTWELAQPFRTLSHNGEINTVRGNAAWMRAREQLFDGQIFGEDVRHVLPVISPDGSDSATLDNVAELLMHAGRSLPHVMMMLVPEAWQNDPLMPREKRDFYQYHSCLIEPWDGPAALAFTDGARIGAILDRNGLRPARWTVTRDGLVVLASETGVLEIAPEDIERTGRLEPGRMFLVDTALGRIIEDEELKRTITTARPYGQWLANNTIRLEDIRDVGAAPERARDEPLSARQKVFGYTDEDLRLLMAPMALAGEEAVGAMGNDAPLAVLSERPRLLFDYFKQHFAQVTNPAVDPIREELVMSLMNYLGGEGNLLLDLPDYAQMLELRQPILDDDELYKLRKTHQIHFRQPATLPMLYPVAEGGAGLKSALDELCRQASLAVLNNHSVLILSDRGASEHMAPVPSLLATAAVHHHLMRNATRMRCGIIVETGEAREIHHFCLLFGYGAGAANPYLALDTLDDMVKSGLFPGLDDPAVARKHYVKAVNKGLLKVMSKMGVSTLQSYHGAQIFEAIGLSPEVIDRYFTGTTSRISGIDLDVIAEECRLRHERAYPKRVEASPLLEVGGNYYYRAQGERHLWNPETVARLQRAVREEDLGSYREYAARINQAAGEPITLRQLWEVVPAREPLPLSEVEPAAEIVKHFATGAMSFGSISAEAHENLAIAMNRIGGKSNTGEGGEREERFLREPNGDSRRSAIKQVASGRFGVTTWYLVNADELQIKVAQGAKPGEGGQLPGHKVDAVIAKTRHSTPGVTLISPPPHHDIYSIEDLAQLIYDLKNVNPTARISVKLVAEAGVGTVAAGVAKARADVILIAGHDGGTGAAPQSSIKHAGAPWELGLSETHQVLVKNDLRSRVVLQADGQLRTGRDVVIAALLGAEEFGFATAPLVASGCIMMRKCHLNTCPVGIATQDPVLRARFGGTPEHVIRFMFYVAEEARELMAALGFRRLRELVGRVDKLRLQDTSSHWKASRLDFSDVLTPAQPGPGVDVCKTRAQEHDLDGALDHQLIARSRSVLESGRGSVVIELPLRNVHRTVGAMLAGEIVRRHGKDGLAPGSISLRFTGSAGQSFGAFMVDGMAISLEGDANDYVGKGMSGGVLSVRVPARASFEAHRNVIIGNVALYGATSGRAFFEGVAGERFAVRNSGATAVVEGVGDHACEYMTGGSVVVLGRVGRNFAAGMSGGLAYVLDEEGSFRSKCNPALVELERPDAADLESLSALVAEHVRLTGSKRGAALLASWAEAAAAFVKVVPREYRKVLATSAGPQGGEERAPSRTTVEAK